MIHNRLKFTSLLLAPRGWRLRGLGWHLSQPGFDPSYEKLICLATLMSSNRTKQICLWMTIYIYIYIYIYIFCLEVAMEWRAWNLWSQIRIHVIKYIYIAYYTWIRISIRLFRNSLAQNKNFPLWIELPWPENPANTYAWHTEIARKKKYTKIFQSWCKAIRLHWSFPYKAMVVILPRD